MSGSILRRCTICKKFHASYLIQDTKLGECYLCYACWKSQITVNNQIVDPKVETELDLPVVQKDKNDNDFSE